MVKLDLCEERRYFADAYYFVFNPEFCRASHILSLSTLIRASILNIGLGFSDAALSAGFSRMTCSHTHIFSEGYRFALRVFREV